jgi:hypothetical protein
MRQLYKFLALADWVGRISAKNVLWKLSITFENHRLAFRKIARSFGTDYCLVVFGYLREHRF